MASKKLEKVSNQKGQKSSILKKAFLRACQLLAIDRNTIQAVLGLSAASVSRLTHNQYDLDPSSKEGEIALTFLRIFRSLDALFGGNSEQSRLWIHSENLHLGGKPIELMTQLGGLFEVAGYLDAMRGKV